MSQGAVGAGKKEEKKKTSMFVINGGMPVEDKIMGIASLDKVLRGRIKVGSKAVNLRASITISIARTRSLPPLVAPTRKVFKF